MLNENFPLKMILIQNPIVFWNNNFSFFFIMFNFYQLSKYLTLLTPNNTLIKNTVINLISNVASNLTKASNASNALNALKISKVKKNYFYFMKLNKLFKYSLTQRFYKFKNLIKYNKFFSPLTHFKINSSKSFKINFLKTPQFFIKTAPFNKVFLQNWNLLIGGGLSPFYWEFMNNKKWIRRDMAFKYFKPFFTNLSQAKTAFFKNILNQDLKNTSIFFKKLIINEFFYISKLGLKLNELSYLIKANLPSLIKKNDKWPFSKPYLPLYNSLAARTFVNYPNYLTFKLFYSYSKIFLFLQRNTFFPRPLTNLNFKLFNFKSFNRTVTKTSFTDWRDSNLSSFCFFKNSTFPATASAVYIKKPLSNKLKLFFFRFSKIRSKTFKNKYFFKSIVAYILNSPLSKSRRLLYKKLKALTRRGLRFNKFNNLLTSFRSMLFQTSKLFGDHGKIIRLVRSPYLNNKTLSFRLIDNKQDLYNFFFWGRRFQLYTWTTTAKSNLTAKNNLLDFFLEPQKSYIFKNYKLLIYFTKEKNSFLSNKYGFLFLTDPFSFSEKTPKLISNIKKNLYSFLYRNELQRYILKRYSKTNVSLNPINEESSLKPYLDLSNDLNSYKFYDMNASFFNKNSFSSVAHSHFLIKNWTNYEKDDSARQGRAEEDLNFNIKRIRFKPGYMSLWREAREVLKLSLNLKIKYQYRLTRYLSRFNKFIRFKTFLVNELKLSNTILKSKLLPDENSIELFINNGLIFINGFNCFNQNYQIFIGDFIQLVVSIKYYLLHKWLINWNMKKKNRLKNAAKKKLYTQIDFEEKQRSYKLPKWVLFSKNITADSPNYLEIDYFTLSFFVLYEPFLWTDVNPYNILDTRFGVINMYNWKYIT